MKKAADHRMGQIINQPMQRIGFIG